MLRSQVYYINSRNRQSGTNESFTYSIPIPPHEDYDRVTVTQANIPLSYYLVQDGYNIFILSENGSNATIDITPGNYTAQSFANVLVIRLNALSPNGYTYTCTLPDTYSASSTGKYSYSVTNNSGVQPQFIFTINLFEQMGFAENTTATFVGDTLTSTNVLKFVLEDTLFIHSDICINYKDDVLQEIFFNNGVPYANITYLSPNPVQYSRRLNTNKSNLFNFYLTNEDGEIMNLNGLNWNMSIVLYKEDDISSKIKEYLKIKLTQDLEPKIN